MWRAAPEKLCAVFTNLQRARAPRKLVESKCLRGCVVPICSSKLISAGPKTIFFWAPSFKWALVIAGIGDLARPAEKLSASQSTALAATGIIWSRYSMVIIPKNYNLFSVNVFVALTGLYQLLRIYRYNQTMKAENKS